jgi:hypothetical protein
VTGTYVAQGAGHDGATKAVAKAPARTPAKGSSKSSRKGK